MTERGAFVTPAPGEDLEVTAPHAGYALSRVLRQPALLQVSLFLRIGGTERSCHTFVTIVLVHRISLREGTRGRWVRAGTGAQGRTGQIRPGSARRRACGRRPQHRPGRNKGTQDRLLRHSRA